MPSWADRTVDEMFRSAAATYPQRALFDCVPSRPATGIASGPTSYADVTRSIDAIAEQLQAHGVARGVRVVFYLEEPIASVLFNLACAHLGAIPVPLSPSFSNKALGDLVARVGGKAVVTDKAHAVGASSSVPTLCFAEDGLPAHCATIDPRPHRSFADALARLTALAQHTARDVFVFQPTSGTTGAPKVIMRAHRVFARVAWAHELSIPGDHRAHAHRVLFVAALTHGMGQYALATTLCFGGTLCVPSEIDTHTSLREVLQLAPDLLFLTPRVLRALYDQLGNEGHDAMWLGENARVLYVGGSATDPQLLRDLDSTGLVVSEGYGASEISLLSMTLPHRWREGTSGEVLPDVTLRVAEDGELLASSPDGVMLGYFGDDALTAEAFTADGFYRTGDYCDIDADNYLHYRGRKRDVFNTKEGANIHPGRIEALVEALPAVKQAILIGDQRPYVSALIVVEPRGASSSEADGYLDESTHAATYAGVRAQLERVNAQLEGIEQVRRIALFDRAFADDVYKAVGHAKISRNRRLVGERYAARIVSLY